MADYIEIDIPVLKSDIQAMTEEVNLIRNEMKDMFAEIRKLDAMWDGPANMAFNMQFASDYQMMEEMCATVEEIIAFGANARSEYLKCENAVQAAIEEIKI